MSTDIFQLALDELDNVKGVRIASMEDRDGTVYRDMVIVMKEDKRVVEAAAVTEAEISESKSVWPQPLLKGCLITVASAALVWTAAIILFMWIRG